VPAYIIIIIIIISSSSSSSSSKQDYSKQQGTKIGLRTCGS
jgi:hypothetical protein